MNVELYVTLISVFNIPENSSSPYILNFELFPTKLLFPNGCEHLIELNRIRNPKLPGILNLISFTQETPLSYPLKFKYLSRASVTQPRCVSAKVMSHSA